MNVIIRKVYNLTCDGNQFISFRPPDALPDSYYSLVEVTYSQNMIISIKGIYVGRNLNIKSECIFNNIDIDELKPKNYPDSYLQLLWEYIDKMDEDEKNNIISSLQIIDLEGDVSMVLEQIFMVQLASTLFYFHLMTEDQIKLEYPFYPLKIRFPYEIDICLIDKNIINTLVYPAKLFFNIAIKNHGKLWVSQIVDFYNTWESIIPQKYIVDIDKTDIIYESILGYSEYLYLETGFIYDHFRRAENVITDGADHIEALTRQSLDAILNHDQKVHDKLEYAALLITTISTLALKTLKADTDVSIQEIMSSTEESKQELIHTFAEINHLKDQSLQEMEEAKNKLYNDIAKNINEYMAQVKKKTEDVDSVIDELQRQLKVYTTRNIQELQLSKQDIVKFMYDQVPLISRKVEEDMNEIVDKKIMQIVEENFKDVLAEYQEVAQQRINYVVDMILEEKVSSFKRIFKDASKDIFNHVNNAGKYMEKAKEQSDRAEKIVSGSIMQTEIDLMKREISELRKSIRDMAVTMKIEY